MRLRVIGVLRRGLFYTRHLYETQLPESLPLYHYLRQRPGRRRVGEIHPNAKKVPPTQALAVERQEPGRVHICCSMAIFGALYCEPVASKSLYTPTRLQQRWAEGMGTKDAEER